MMKDEHYFSLGFSMKILLFSILSFFLFVSCGNDKTARIGYLSNPGLESENGTNTNGGGGSSTSSNNGGTTTSDGTDGGEDDGGDDGGDDEGNTDGGSDDGGDSSDDSGGLDTGSNYGGDGGGDSGTDDGGDPEELDPVSNLKFVFNNEVIEQTEKTGLRQTLTVEATGLKVGKFIEVFSGNTGSVEGCGEDGTKIADINITNAKMRFDLGVSASWGKIRAGENVLFARIRNSKNETSDCSEELLTYVRKECPTNFVPVYGNAELIVNPENEKADDFCVMTYEAKSSNGGNNDGIAVSKPGDFPWRIGNGDPESYHNKCRDLGENYHLLTNYEYMTIARDIEEQKENWSGGAVGGGYVFVGNSEGKVGKALAASSDNANNYYGIDKTKAGYQKYRRNHLLSSGKYIWDIIGNVAEAVNFGNNTVDPDGENEDFWAPSTCGDKKRDTTSYDNPANIYCDGGIELKHLGAKGTYVYTSNVKGLGNGFVQKSGREAFRGGSYREDWEKTGTFPFKKEIRYIKAGLFTMTIFDMDEDQRKKDAGFRCALTVVED